MGDAKQLVAMLIALPFFWIGYAAWCRQRHGHYLVPLLIPFWVLLVFELNFSAQFIWMTVVEHQSACTAIFGAPGWAPQDNDAIWIWVVAASIATHVVGLTLNATIHCQRWKSSVVD